MTNADDDFLRAALAELRSLQLPRRRCGLSFDDPGLEAAYQRWHAAIFGRDLKMGLLLSSFLYFVASVTFAAWSRINDVASTMPLSEKMADATIVVLLPLAFAASFSSCAARRPQAFASLVLLLTISFVVLRSTLIDATTVYAPPVLLILIVCISLGTALLRMPFIATALVGIFANALYAVACLARLRYAPAGAAYGPAALLLIAAASALASRQLEASQRRTFRLQHGWHRLRLASAEFSAAFSDSAEESCGPPTAPAATAAALHAAASADAAADTDAFADADAASFASTRRPGASPTLMPLVAHAASAPAGDTAAGGGSPSAPNRTPAPAPAPAHAPARGHAGAGHRHQRRRAGYNAGDASRSLLPPSQRGHRRSNTVGSALTIDALRRLEGRPMMRRDTASSASDSRLAVWAQRESETPPESAVESLLLALRASVHELTGQMLFRADAHDLTSPDSLEAVQRALHAAGSSSLREHLARGIAELLRPTLLRRLAAREPRPLSASAAAAGSDAGVGDAFGDTLQPRTKFALVRIDELPRWHTPYPFVLTSYRANFSYSLCIASLFRLHNETVNVWSELLPAAVFSAWTVELLDRHDNKPRIDRGIVGAGLVCATVLRPVCSAMAHLFHSTSPAGYVFWWSVDYASICVAILASSLVSGHFAFYCMQPLQLLYFASAVGLLSTSLVAVLAVASPALRATSFLLFVTFCNGVPFVYQVAAKLSSGAYHVDVPDAYLAYWGGSLGLFIFGLLIKSSHLPERAVRQRWNDLFGASHQLWHLCINGAFALGTFVSWDIYLSWRDACDAELGRGQ